jgi:hypothetical protein
LDPRQQVGVVDRIDPRERPSCRVGAVYSIARDND